MHNTGAARAFVMAPVLTEMTNMAGALTELPPNISSSPALMCGVMPPPFYQAPFPPAQPPAGRATASSRSGVCASRHMAAEQRRRARINERLEALRNLVPHSARANTAAFLTEVYDHIAALHKQVKRLGGGVLDLNVAASEGKDKTERAGRDREHKSSSGHSRKRSKGRRSDDEESEVESESEGQATSGGSGPEAPVQNPSIITVSAPSLFEHSAKKAAEAGPALSLSQPVTFGTVQNFHMQNGGDNTTCPALSPALVSGPPTLDFGLSVGVAPSQPMDQSASRYVAPDSCNTQMTLGMSGCMTAAAMPPTNLRPREIQPAVVPILPHHQLPSGSAAAAAQAAVDAAAQAQGWTHMAAVMAQAMQAQAMQAAQAHAQAQVQLQAQAQAHAHAHANAQAQLSCATTVQSKKPRRRGTGEGSSGSRHRNGQPVVRPIAQKPPR
eukprot:jgi/Mesen1/2975/ME000176S02012